MKLKTLQFGEIEFSDDLIIEFKDGILGFEDLKKYVMITEEEGIFYWLTAVDEPEIVFPLFPISSLKEEYPQKDGYEVFGIVRLAKEPSDITINLKAPIYINQSEKTGYQKILDTEKYPVDYNLFVEKTEE
ncbi:MAG: flagellar assembly protein FliW [Chlorobi bacterium]|nr:flagellar assembly protein FliW [Chlorobiota bacterium]